MKVNGLDRLSDYFNILYAQKLTIMYSTCKKVNKVKCPGSVKVKTLCNRDLGEESSMCIKKQSFLVAPELDVADEQKEFKNTIRSSRINKSKTQIHKNINREVSEIDPEKKCVVF